MDAFTKILTSLKNTVTTNPLGSGLSLMALISQMSMASKEKSALDRSMYYAKHPEAISALESSFEKPLSAGLTKGVGSIVDASMAEKGLSQAPGIQSQVLAQALAPYQQNEQQMAITEALKAIGLPIDALSALKSTSNPGSLALMLKQLTQPSTPAPTTSTSPSNSTGGIIFDPNTFPGIGGADPGVGVPA